MCRVVRRVDAGRRPARGRFAATLGFVPGAHKRNVVLALTYLLLTLAVVSLVAGAL